jgi:hypothetical protein
MLMIWPSLIATDGTRRPFTKIPLRLPLSVAAHWPAPKRNKMCARETSGLAMHMSARGSRPTTMSRPRANVRCDDPDQTVITGLPTGGDTGMAIVVSDGAIMA